MRDRMRGLAWLSLTSFLAMALLFMPGAALGAEATYESCVVVHSYDLKVVDTEGKALTGTETYFNPVLAGQPARLTFLVQNFDADTDIDTINLTFRGAEDIADQSDLSSAESNGPGDWAVQQYIRSIVYTAVTDGDKNDDDDDALDRNDELTLVVQVNVPSGAGFFGATLTVKELQGTTVPGVDEEATQASRSFEYLYIRVAQGDMFLLSSITYPAQNQRTDLLISDGAARYGVGTDGAKYEEIPDAEEFNGYLSKLYFFMTDDVEIVKGLEYTITNPTMNTPCQYSLRVILYDISISPDEVVIGRTSAPGLDTTTLLAPGLHDTYIYGDSILGESGGAHYLDDGDDDNDGYPDVDEIAARTDPLDPRPPYPKVDDGPAGSKSEIPMTIILVAALVGVGVAIIIVLMRVGVIGRGVPRAKKPKKTKKKKAEAEVVWEKPRRGRKAAREPEAPAEEDAEEEAEEEAPAEPVEAVKVQKKAPARARPARAPPAAPPSKPAPAAKSAVKKAPTAPKPVPPAKEVAEAAVVEAPEEGAAEEERDLFAELEEDLDFEELEAELAGLDAEVPGDAETPEPKKKDTGGASDPDEADLEDDVDLDELEKELEDI